MKFQEDIFNGFQVKHRHSIVTEQLPTKFKGEKLKIQYSRVMVDVLCTSSYGMVYIEGQNWEYSVTHNLILTSRLINIA